jgi:hypothetical protein
MQLQHLAEQRQRNDDGCCFKIDADPAMRHERQ